MSKAESEFRKSEIHSFNRLIFTDEDFVAAAMSNQEQNTSNNPPIVEHTICLLNNPRQEQVKTKCISTSISDSQETSTNYHTSIFSKCPISNKISIPETKTFAQLLDEFVSVNKTSRKQKSYAMINIIFYVTKQVIRNLFLLYCKCN